MLRYKNEQNDLLLLSLCCKAVLKLDTLGWQPGISKYLCGSPVSPSDPRTFYINTSQSMVTLAREQISELPSDFVFDSASIS